jgi:putative ABC transport system permease protein
MNTVRRFLLRLLSAVRPQMAEDDLAREIKAHLALLEDEYRRRGMSPEQATLAARRAIGSVALAKDRHRDTRSIAWLDDLRRDVRHAARMLARCPGFTSVALLTLALGIGATTAVFSVVEGVFLQPLPYPEPDRLVRIFGPPPTRAGIDGPPSRMVDLPSQTFETLRLVDRAFSHVTGYMPTTLTLTGRGDAVRLVGSHVSAAAFPMLGIPPLIGRGFEPREEAAGADSVVILSEAAWRQYFNADEALIGQLIVLDGRGCVVVGVMPSRFSQSGMHFPDPQAQFWVPYVAPAPDSRNRLNVAVMARLAPGVSLRAAEDVVNSTVGQPGQGRYEVSRVHDEIVRPVKPALLMLSVAVILVLLIACVNVANLLLARTASRERELAVRRAVGAVRSRLIRQLLTESILLSLLGGIVGTAVAFGGVALLRVLATSLNRRDLIRGANLPRLDQIGIDGSVLAFTVGVALVAGLLFGLIPAVQQSRHRETNVLREKHVSHRIRGTLVVAEIAMAMMLLVGGALLIHSFLRLSSVERGYNTTNVLTFQAATLGPSRAENMAFADRLVARLAALPGVMAVGYSNNLPLVQQGFTRDVSARPTAPGERAPRPYPSLHAISPGFAAAIGLRIVRGRTFSAGELARREALVSRAFANSGFFDGPALGHQIYQGKNTWEVVGIVEDVRQFNLDQPPGSEMFIIDFVAAPPGFGGTYFAVRTEAVPLALSADVRTIVRQIDPAATFDNVATMEQIVSNAVSGPRLYAVLLGTFAAVAVSLAAIGIYGVLAFIVTQRTREIGIRMALGAPQAAVVSLVVRQSAVQVAVGVLLGIVGAAWLSRYLEGLLFGVRPLDLPTFVVAGVGFTLVALLAAYRPARCATQVDPLVALRAE